MGHRYRGHRAKSFSAIDINELVELRARQRTFDGAYRRTALSNLACALTFLRLFDRRFYRSILYTVLAGVLSIVAFFRGLHSQHDFADQSVKALAKAQFALETVGQGGTRVFGRPFVTAGWIVVAVALIVATMEIILLVLILEL